MTFVAGALSFLSVIFGMVFLIAPKKAIEFQIAFYRLINWRMEPVSWKREIANTRFMGMVCVACGVGGWIVLL